MSTDLPTDRPSLSRSDALTRARSTFTAAAQAFIGLVTEIPPERYDGPGLGEWDLRSLVGHTGRALTTVATYLGTRADEVAAPSPALYFALAKQLAGDGADLRRRGVEAGQVLGNDPVNHLRVAHAEAEDALDLLGGEDVLVRTFVGGMRVSDYLPTRTFELTVHTLDIARALGASVTPPQAAVAETLRVAADSALEQGLGVEVVLTLTGREPLPEGRSVVP